MIHLNNIDRRIKHRCRTQKEKKNQTKVMIPTDDVCSLHRLSMKKQKVFATLEATIVPFHLSWHPLSENHDHHPQQTNRSSRTWIQRSLFSARIWSCQTPNQVAETQLLTFCNTAHAWFSDIKLILGWLFFKIWLHWQYQWQRSMYGTVAVSRLLPFSWLCTMLVLMSIGHTNRS
jgi:hypothetical protein